MGLGLGLGWRFIFRLGFRLGLGFSLAGRALAVKLLILPSGPVDGPSGLSVACAGAAALPAGPAEESIESRIASERACLGLGLG